LKYLKLICGPHFLAVDFFNYVAALEACVRGGPVGINEVIVCVLGGRQMVASTSRP